jgi:hypothetical protein
MALYGQRFVEIFENLSSTYMAQNVCFVMHQFSPEEWLERVKKYTPGRLVELLGRPNPPTLAELKSVPYEITNDCGDYAHVMEGGGGEDNYLYCGSATALAGSRFGFQAGIDRHTKSGPE